MDETLLRLLLFLCLIPLTRSSSGWLLELVYRSAGVDEKDVYTYRFGVRHRKRPYGYVTNWLVSTSPNSKKTGWLLLLYLLCTIPAVLGFNLSIFGLFLPILDWPLGYAGVALGVLCAACAGANLVYLLCTGRKVPRPGRALLKGVLLVVLSAAMLAAMVLFVYQMATVSKLQVNAGQVQEILVSNGLVPKEEEAHSSLNQGLIARDGTFLFQFFDMKTKSAAEELYQQGLAMLLESSKQMQGKRRRQGQTTTTAFIRFVRPGFAAQPSRSAPRRCTPAAPGRTHSGWNKFSRQCIICRKKARCRMFCTVPFRFYCSACRSSRCAFSPRICLFRRSLTGRFSINATDTAGSSHGQSLPSRTWSAGWFLITRTACAGSM